MFFEMLFYFLFLKNIHLFESPTVNGFYSAFVHFFVGKLESTISTPRNQANPKCIFGVHLFCHFYEMNRSF